MSLGHLKCFATGSLGSVLTAVIISCTDSVSLHAVRGSPGVGVTGKGTHLAQIFGIRYHRPKSHGCEVFFDVAIGQGREQVLIFPQTLSAAAVNGSLTYSMGPFVGPVVVDGYRKEKPSRPETALPVFHRLVFYTSRRASTPQTRHPQAPQTPGVHRRCCCSGGKLVQGIWAGAREVVPDSSPVSRTSLGFSLMLGFHVSVISASASKFGRLVQCFSSCLNKCVSGICWACCHIAAPRRYESKQPAKMQASPRQPQLVSPYDHVKSAHVAVVFSTCRVLG